MNWNVSFHQNLLVDRNEVMHHNTNYISKQERRSLDRDIRHLFKNILDNSSQEDEYLVHDNVILLLLR
jgi:23S rRNA maturation-related 3'-5' exoribonuclease YhaM